jgi:hypothetical protein
MTRYEANKKLLSAEMRLTLVLSDKNIAAENLASIVLGAIRDIDTVRAEIGRSIVDLSEEAR